ncbi:MAG TPA: hypothetical protein PKA00_04685 [Saprospiraceae bacterium]|nr:hypothetical protein [Saprospiraceae bacterium]HMQ82177.1 hypothetical protein [Saprospiraceae bacterium]
MSANKLLVATLAGGVTFFLLGWLVWGMLLADYMAKNAGSATGVAKEPMVMWAIALSNLLSGLLLAVIFGRWAGIKTFMTGAKAGAVLGLLLGLSYDLLLFGTSNVTTMNALVVDVLANVVVTAVAGGVVGWVLGRNEKS